MAGRIFFSYARRDADFVLKVASALRSDGVELWVDQLHIPSGERWDESVQVALKSCSCLVVVLSPYSVNSHNVLDEVDYALREQKPVVPVLLRPCEIPFRLNRIQHIDFTAGYDNGYRVLLAALTTAKSPIAAQPPPSRGGLYRHMALGAALMLCTLFIIGWISAPGTVESGEASAQQETPADAAAATAPTAQAGSAPTDAGAQVAASTASAPISPGSAPGPDVAANGANHAPAAPADTDTDSASASTSASASAPTDAPAPPVVADSAPSDAPAPPVVADPAPTDAPAPPVDADPAPSAAPAVPPPP